MFGSDPMDTALVSFGYDGVMKIFEASQAASNITDGLTKVFNGSHAEPRLEKMFKVENGHPVEVNN